MTDNMEYYNFTKFRKYFDTIEGECKRKCEAPNYYCYTGVILLKREKKPVINKMSLVNADLFLYQMAWAYDFKDKNTSNRWFPNTHYCCDYGYTQSIWKKLKSKKYCQKIMPLFEAKDVSELKSIIEKVNSKEPLRFNNRFEDAPNIYQSISTEEIATIN